MKQTGRPPKPTALKLLEGNPGQRKIDMDEVKPAADNIECPEWLQGSGREVWDRLAPKLQKLDLLTNIDVDFLAVFCKSLADFVRADEHLRTEGEVVVQGGKPIANYRTGEIETIGGQPIPSPWISIQNKAAVNIAKFGGRFGLSPSDRVGLNVKLLEGEDELKGFIKGRAGG